MNYQNFIKGVDLKSNGLTCVRQPGSLTGLAFCLCPLEGEDEFEIRIEQVDNKYAGSVRIGVTTNINISGAQNIRSIGKLIHC